MKPIGEAATPLLKTNPGFVFDGGSCPVREVLTRIGDKWSLYVIFTLQPKPMRFNELKRQVEGISQRMLTVTLRSLERDGLVSRTVFDTTPPSVEYRLTTFGQSLAQPISALGNWAAENRSRLRDAQARFDRDQGQGS
ncbi:transcriptional regulator [Notoacmeibacter ruber]|uniref:Transcriptional regulator n=2 Tax=Notoacmeibacter ruber TaxID=2670375 RepID=A0A3L7JFL1_9HYPH|nr:helix-turn-helix domain-containing protein [Notoacmeibacter ruber]RLQ89476.1 transcriptional regulator [Notoacmeibacter ruber]